MCLFLLFDSVNKWNTFNLIWCDETLQVNATWINSGMRVCPRSRLQNHSKSNHIERKLIPTPSHQASCFLWNLVWLAMKIRFLSRLFHEHVHAHTSTCLCMYIMCLFHENLPTRINYRRWHNAHVFTFYSTPRSSNTLTTSIFVDLSISLNTI